MYEVICEKRAKYCSSFGRKLSSPIGMLVSMMNVEIKRRGNIVQRAGKSKDEEETMNEKRRTRNKRPSLSIHRSAFLAQRFSSSLLLGAASSYAQVP